MPDSVDTRVAGMLMIIQTINETSADELPPEETAHAFRNLYGFALDALKRLSRTAGIPACSEIADEFTNEIARLEELLAHRDNAALDLVRDLGITDDQIDRAIFGKESIAEALRSVSEDD